MVMSDLKESFYDRVLKIRDVDKDVVEELSKIKLAIIGLGGLGADIVATLVKNGFRYFKLIDPDILLYTDVYRGVSFKADDTGYFKVEVVKKILERLAPDVEVTIYPQTITDFNIDRLLRNVDLVIDATDNIFSKGLINRYSVSKGIPVIYTAVKDNNGIIIFLEPDETACFECFHPDLENIRDGYINGYGFQYIYSMVYSIASSEATSYILGYDPQLHGSMMRISPNLNMNINYLSKNPQCRVCSSKAAIEYPDFDYQYFIKGDTFIYTSDERVRLDIERLSRELAKKYILFRRGDIGVFFEYPGNIRIGVSYSGTVVVIGVTGFEEGVSLTRRLVEDTLYQFVID